MQQIPSELCSLFADGVGAWHRQAEQMAARRLAALNLIRRAALSHSPYDTCLLGAAYTY